MSKLILKLSAFLLVLFTINACNKSDDNITVTTTNKAIQKKWILTSGNSLNYKWIEFTKNGYYIIVKNSGTALSNRYTVSSSDSTSIELANVGTLKVNKTPSTLFDFAITAKGSTTAVGAVGFEAPIVVDGGSGNTNLFCQLWNLNRYIKYDSTTLKYDTINYPTTTPNFTSMAGGYILITNYGTYFTTRYEINSSSIDTSMAAGRWQWTDPTQTAFNYTYCDTCNIDNGPVTIVNLTNTIFNYTEPGMGIKMFGFMSR